MKKILLFVAAATILFAGCKKGGDNTPEVNGEEFIPQLIGMNEADAIKKIQETYPKAVKLNDIQEGKMSFKAWGWGEQIDTKDDSGKDVKVCQKTITYSATDGIVDDPQFILFSKTAMNMAEIVPMITRGDAAIAKTKYKVNEDMDTYTYSVGDKETECKTLDEFKSGIQATKGITSFEYSAFLANSEDPLAEDYSEMSMGYYYEFEKFAGIYSLIFDAWVLY